jgi:hypothetical protein
VPAKIVPAVTEVSERQAAQPRSRSAICQQPPPARRRNDRRSRRPSGGAPNSAGTNPRRGTTGAAHASCAGSPPPLADADQPRGQATGQGGRKWIPHSRHIGGALRSRASPRAPPRLEQTPYGLERDRAGMSLRCLSTVAVRETVVLETFGTTRERQAAGSASLGGWDGVARGRTPACGATSCASRAIVAAKRARSQRSPPAANSNRSGRASDATVADSRTAVRFPCGARIQRTKARVRRPTSALPTSRWGGETSSTRVFAVRCSPSGPCRRTVPPCRHLLAPRG